MLPVKRSRSSLATVVFPPPNEPLIMMTMRNTRRLRRPPDSERHALNPVGGEAAVNRDALARDVRGGGHREEGDDRGDFVRLPHAAHGRGRKDPGQPLR